MLRKTAHFILYLSTLQKPAAGAGFCNVLKYKADTFYLSTIQKPAPEVHASPDATQSSDRFFKLHILQNQFPTSTSRFFCTMAWFRNFTVVNTSLSF